jgi:hypothetical protein
MSRTAAGYKQVLLLTFSVTSDAAVSQHQLQQDVLKWYYLLNLALLKVNYSHSMICPHIITGPHSKAPTPLRPSHYDMSSLQGLCGPHTMTCPHSKASEALTL